MIYFITGGERSGKSRYAQQLALTLSAQPVYVATARKWDSNFEARIRLHQEERNEQWTTYEEEKYLSKLPLINQVAVIDCITLWLTNFFTDLDFNLQHSLDTARKELEQWIQIPADLIIISNELGMGVHAPTEAGRKFVELQGWINQYIASQADQVVLMISGIPVKIK